jgi:hypothetical protein
MMGRLLVVHLLLVALVHSGCASGRSARPAPDLNTDRGMAEAVTWPTADPPRPSDHPTRDWFNDHPFVKYTAIGAGLAAGVVIVLVAVVAVGIATDRGAGTGWNWH